MSPAAADYVATFQPSSHDAPVQQIVCSCSDLIAEDTTITLQDALNAIAEHNMKHQTRTSI